MNLTRRLGLGLAVFLCVALAVPRDEARGQDKTRTKLLSELPEPKAGDKLKVQRAEVKTKADKDGKLDVVSITRPAGEGEEVTIPTTYWSLDIDGWFDAEGVNVAAMFPRSGLWGMRAAAGGKTDKSENTYTQIGDIITHIDSIPVTSYERMVYAINAAKNPRDLPVVVMDGRSGGKQLVYVSAHKSVP